MTTTRIGLIVPSSNTVVESDFLTACPAHTTFHTARMFLDTTTPAAEMEMLEDHAPRAAIELATAHCHAVAFACTSAGALIGLDGEARLIDRLAQKTNCPVISTNEAVSQSLRALGASKVAVLTPYIEALNEGICTTLEQRGIAVSEIYGMGLTVNFAISEVTPQAIVEFAKQHITDTSIDALFVSCTNLRSTEAISQLSAVCDVPVVTSNAATFDAVIAATPHQDLTATATH